MAVVAFFTIFGVIFVKNSIMTLIKSISGIRGTIGGVPGEDLTPLDVLKFTSAYAMWLREISGEIPLKVVVGRDARISGPMVEQIVCSTLCGMGVDVLNLGLATTPTVGIMVAEEKAQGGIIITASHNPGEWNALKLLNNMGEFISAETGERILAVAGSDSFEFAKVDGLGTIIDHAGHSKLHIDKILGLELVQAEQIKKAGLRVALDCVNSVGGMILPDLLRELGVDEVIEINCEPNGIFPHNPEPLPEHLGDISRVVVESGVDLGLAVDPDVDRLAIIDENGRMFGEEYTLVAVADYVLGKTPGNTVSNLSSTRALSDVTGQYGGLYFASAVGEVNVVTVMKENDAVIGGEGNGGVIYPPLHYGRDALTGIALFLSQLAETGKKVSELKKMLPQYYMSKNKISIEDPERINEIMLKVKEEYEEYPVSTVDGVKIELPAGWIHLRKSNTEPIIRIYTEAGTAREADELAADITEIIKDF